MNILLLGIHIGTASQIPESRQIESKNCCLFSNIKPFSHVNLINDSFDIQWFDIDDDFLQWTSIRSRFLTFNEKRLGTCCKLHE